MEDSKIIELYWKRSEEGVTETSRKYTRYCHCISYNILGNDEDADECVNDTWLCAWRIIPPQRPNCLSVFLGKITRNLSLNRLKRYSAKKRGSGVAEIALSELEDCIPSSSGMEEESDNAQLTEALNRFLTALPKEKRVVFVQRYWYLCKVQEIAQRHGMSESRAKSMLFRIRKELKLYLESEGIVL